MQRVRVLTIAASTILVASTVGVAVAAQRSSAPRTASVVVGNTCAFTSTQPCVLVDSLATSMAVPLLSSIVRGTDGGTTRPSLGFTQINASGAVTAAGFINGHAARVVASGTDLATDQLLTVRGRATAIYAISGTTYRYAVFESSVSQDSDLQVVGVAIGVRGSLHVHSCVQRGAGRIPARDCAAGTQKTAYGSAVVPAAGAPGTQWAFTVGLHYYQRSVNTAGAPLTAKSTLRTGHWTVRALLDSHGASSVWQTEWSISGIGLGRQSGAGYIQTTKANLPIAGHSDTFGI